MSQQKITYIAVDKLHAHPANPRKNLGDLTELADSIKAKGVLQNLTVVPYWSPVHKRIMAGLYTVIIGHRRLAAAKEAGLKELPCVVADMSPQEQIETMMVENVQRSDLTVYEQAEGFQMMLEMGGSVEDVAKKTGFSETTVRRRVKLLDLDKDEFKKAEERGATMQDYLKLNDIKDLDRRNKVLATIGTNNFSNALASAKADEQAQEYIDKVVADLSAAEWCQKLPEGPVDRGKITYVRMYNRWQRGDVERPKDADTVKYFFRYDEPRKEVTLYKEAVPEEVNKKAETRKQLTAALDDIRDELDSISATHKEMREEFIRNFAADNTYEMDIEAFAAEAVYFAHSSGYYTNVNPEYLSSLLSIPMEGKELDQSAWGKLLFNRPRFALLCTVFALLHRSMDKYNTTKFDCDIRASVPKPNTNTVLDMVYKGLKSIGYEMSDEEIQMQEGTHHLYHDAQELVDAYMEEFEE